MPLELRTPFMINRIKSLCCLALRLIRYSGRFLRTPLGVLTAAAAAAAICGLVVAPQGIVAFAVLLGLICVGTAWPWLAMKGLRAGIRFEGSRSREGAATGVVITIENRWPFPVWGLGLRGGVARDSEPSGAPDVALACVPARSKMTFRWSFTPSQRGLYPLSTPLLTTGFPFGVFRAWRAVNVQGGLIVWPETFWLPPLSQGSSTRPASCPSPRRSGDSGERVGVREYRPGDSPRSIHWTRSASRETLVVNEREGLADPAVKIQADLSPPAHGGGSETREMVIRIVASIAESLAVGGSGVEIQLDLGDQDPLRYSGPRQGLLDFLATFDSPQGQTKRLLQRGAGRSRLRARRAEICIGTDRSLGLTGWVIEIQTGAGPLRSAAGGRARPWIAVSPQGDVADQLLRQWRTEPRAMAYAR